MVELALASAVIQVPLVAVFLASWANGKFPVFLAVVLVTVFIGTTPRILFLSARETFSEVPRWSIDVEEGVKYGLICVGAFVASFAPGYLLAVFAKHRGGRGIAVEPQWACSAVVLRRVLLAGAVAAAWGCLASAAWVYLRFGRLEISPLEIFHVASIERTFRIGDAEGNMSFLLAGSTASEVCMLLGLWFLLKQQRLSWPLLLVFGINGALATLPGIFFGSRLGVLKPAILAAFAVIGVRGFRLRYVAYFAPIILVAVPLVVTQGLLRTGEVVVSGDDGVNATQAFEILVRWFVETGHFVAVERTGFIADYVLSGWNEFPFAGSLYLALATFIPRFLWPEKPSVHEGNFVNVAIFGNEPTSGAPAGLIGGLLLNFRVPGLLVGAFTYGVLIGKFDVLRGKSAACVRSFCLAYIMFFPAAFDLLQSSIAGFLVDAVIRVGVAWLFCWFIVRGSRQEVRGMAWGTTPLVHGLAGASPPRGGSKRGAVGRPGEGGQLRVAETE